MPVLRKLISEVSSETVTSRISVSSCNTDPEAEHHTERVRKLLETLRGHDIICLQGMTSDSLKMARGVLKYHKVIQIFDSVEELEHAPVIFLREKRCELDVDPSEICETDGRIVVTEDYYYTLKPYGYIIGADIEYEGIPLSVFTFGLSGSAEVRDEQLGSVVKVLSESGNDIVLAADTGSEITVLPFGELALYDFWTELGCCPETRNNYVIGRAARRVSRIMYSQRKCGYHVVPDSYTVIKDPSEMSKYRTITGSYTYCKKR